jgi:geranylgeranyl pyrophosphate synthase
LYQQAQNLLEQKLQAAHYPPIVVEAAQSVKSKGIIYLILQIANTLAEQSPTNSVPFATAYHLMHCAFRLIDDAVDADQETSFAEKYGTGVAFFAGLTLWFEAQNFLLHVEDVTVVSNLERVWHTLNHVTETAKTVTLGHVTDCHEAKELCNEERYLQRAAQKSAAIFEMAFKQAASLAKANPETIEKYSLMGYKLGLMLQIKNDLASCYEQNPKRNSLSRKLVSLPVIHAWAAVGESCESEFYQLWATGEATSLLRYLEQNGAISYTFLLLNWLYCQLADLAQTDSPADLDILQFARELTIPLV